MMWLSLALRNIVANRRRSMLALAAIAAAAVAMMLFADYVNAIRVGLRHTTIHDGLGHLRVAARGGFDAYEEKQLQHGMTPAQYAALEKATEAEPTVRRIVPGLSFQGLVSNGPRTLAFSGSGVDPALESAAFSASHEIVKGAQLDASAPDDGVVLGADLAQRLGVEPGQTVTLLTSTVSGAINAADLQVVGIESTGSPERDLHLLRAKLPMVQSLLATDRVSSVALLLDDQADVEEVQRRLGAALPQMELRNWLQMAPYYTQVLGLYENLFRIFGLFILVVSLLGLTTIILTSVLERSREIGVMRALGISAWHVRRAFVLEGLVLCLIGVAVGMLVAAGLGEAINALRITMPPPPGQTEGYPLRVLWDWSATAGIATLVLLLGIAAAWMASGRVTRLKVIDALGAL
ncbi:MAG: ABC transporter permease [Burkholderiaceae bacterium]|nr:ABC transporter permease [Burkholderiaceae bacterium]